MATFVVQTSDGVDYNDLFRSTENINQRTLEVSPTLIRAHSNNAVGADTILFFGRGFGLSGNQLSGVVTEIRFLTQGDDVARLRGINIGAQKLGDAIIDSASETGYEPLLNIFTRFPYIYTGGSGDDGFTGGLGKDVIKGNGGDDRLSGELGADKIFGGNGDDNLSGDYGLSTGASGNFNRGGADRIFGERGNDFIRGDAGNDTISGGDGDDVINGLQGNDRIFGDAGKDRLSGGAGRDVFVFNRAADSSLNAADQIGDYDRFDVIDLRGIDANERARGNQAFSFAGVVDTFTKVGQIALIENGGDYYVAGNTDGNLNDIDFLLQVNFVNSGRLVASDFIL